MPPKSRLVIHRSVLPPSSAKRTAYVTEAPPTLPPPSGLALPPPSPLKPSLGAVALPALPVVRQQAIALPPLPLPGEPSHDLNALLDQAKPVPVNALPGLAEPLPTLSTAGDDIPTFSIQDDIPVGLPIWRYTPLYKASVRGSPMVWWVGFDAKTNELLMTHGYVGGEIRTDRTKVVVNNSGRSIHEQAIQEANHRYLIKDRNDGYRPPGVAPSVAAKPMLASTWKPDSTRLKYPVVIQPKIDGMRMRRRREGNRAIYYSRGNVPWPHMNAQFDSELDVFQSFIPYDVQLDGEAYLPGRFTELGSVMKNMVNLHPELPNLRYYIYDFNTTELLPYETRWQLLTTALQKYIAAGYNNTRFDVLYTNTAKSKDEIFQWHARFTGQGYEGTIIRKLANGAPQGSADFKAALYKSGRSNNMLKFKDRHDAEGVVVGVGEGSGTQAGLATLIVRITHPDAKGNMVTSDVNMNPSYSFEERAEWFKNPSLVIGRQVTYQYFEISEYGVPREPVMKAFRDPEDLD